MKLQNGDYLPVSEIETEQDYQGVIKAAKNCGINVSKAWVDTALHDEKLIEAVFIHPFHGLLHDPIFNDDLLNKLTLNQWIERGGIKREEVKEWMPEAGEECLVKLRGSWYQTNIIAHYNEYIVFDCLDIEISESPFDAYENNQLDKFKPLPTPEEVEREEFVNRCIGQGYEVMDINKFVGHLFDLGCRFKD